MPSNVTWFESLMYLDVLLSIITTIFQSSDLFNDDPELSQLENTIWAVAGITQRGGGRVGRAG